MTKRTIKKLLVANRGEIALRIIRTARTLGIKTVAIYSEADAQGLHVAAADEARLVGPAEAAKSYLNMAAIVATARETQADAIHPGYGFLSERPEFARAIADAGIIFVGPRADVMAALGDKVSARKIAAAAGVPVVPGIATAEVKAVRGFAAEHGYPILVKAAAGGGGRGMRVVADDKSLESALEAASHEALAAFGDGRVFVEKYLARPCHVEIQILGDGHGAVVALGERDCSIQRRHQKIVEESPAPGLADATQKKMIAAAVSLARAAGYTNAGTVEFMVEGDKFYFLEINARLQVEHPVTELRYGVDLVAAQLAVANGGTVSEPSAPRGAAIECRIYAEGAEHDFRPAIGTVLHLNVPSGPGVRFDSHMAPGAIVGAWYDGMLGKLICYGEDREQARTRMVAALDEFTLLGVTNTAAYLRDIVASEAYRTADLSTHFIEEHFKNWRGGSESDDAALVAAAMTAAGALGAAGASSLHASADDGRATRDRSPWAELASFELWKSSR
jgi:acetyl/propionyl-CoA carboxylase alpha subunit